MNFHHLSALCLLWIASATLVGCGGGSHDTVDPGPNNLPVISAVKVEPGVYTGLMEDKEFVGVVTPNTPSSWNNTWYGLHYAGVDPLQIADPDIYVAALQGFNALPASLSGLTYFPINASWLSVYRGTAKITGVTAGQLSGEVDFSPSFKSKSFSMTQLNASTFKQAADLQDITGDWTGRLSYGNGSYSEFIFSVNSGAGKMTAATFGLGCNWTSPNFRLTADTAVNLFKLDLTMSKSTACDFSEKTLSGVAFVYNSPIAGKKRLIWVATTATGQGMSFKADR
jgi:hypothetical protein